MQNREFKNQIMDRLRGITKERGTLTIVFAHGWRHNASPDDDNLARFQKMLQGLALSDRELGDSLEGKYLFVRVDRKKEVAESCEDNDRRWQVLN